MRRSRSSFGFVSAVVAALFFIVQSPAVLALAFQKGPASDNRKTNVIAGATGYIGKSVVRESVRRGYNTIALVRNEDKVLQAKNLYGPYFDGAQVVQCDVEDPVALGKVRQF